MVQRKVSNKLGIHPNKNTLKTHANTKLSLLNHDNSNTKVVDNIKAIKMKKSRSTTERPEVEFTRHSSTNSHVTPTKTPSPKKPSPYKVVELKAIKMKKSRSLKKPDIEFSHRLSMKSDEVSTPVTPIETPSPKKQCFHSSPNYMKSTRSSDHHKAEKTPAKTSSLKKVRTLIKAPSFKHSRTNHKKAVFSENYDARKATCSSTLKEFKFPSYLKLTPGATEAEGISVMKVCPYTYCSLNGHRHSSSPPLNTFLASKRRMLKAQGNITPEVVSPGKRKRCEIQVTDDNSDKDFFVEIHVPRYESSQVSEIGFQDDVNFSDMNCISEKEGKETTDGINTSEMNFSSEENHLSLSENEGSSGGDHSASDLDMDSDSSVSLDQLFSEVSDMEWEEGQILGFPDEEVEIPIKKDCDDDHGIEAGFELEKFADGKLLPCVYDEVIMEFLQFSDAETASDTESSQTDEDYIVEQIADDESICNTKVVEGSFEGEASIFFSNLIEENENNVFLVKDASPEDEPDSTEVNFGSTQSYIEEGKTSEEAEDITKSGKEEELTITINKPEQVYNMISNRGNNSTDEPLDCSSKLWKSVRCKKTDNDTDEDKEFNPRPPNFLPAEPEEEPERVDLRHQDMDERRNAEDWMLDHALQRTVGQLAPARKRKVALLVEAFEAVIPVPKYEPRIRRNSSGLAFARPVQACSG